MNNSTRTSADRSNDTGDAGDSSRAPDKKVRFGLRIKFSLAIMTMVSLIIATIIIFFTYRETGLLRGQIFQFVNRETVHLSNTAQQSIGFEEIAIIEAINDLKNFSFISYAYVLNEKDRIIQYFDLRGEQSIGEPIRNDIDRKFKERSDNENISIIETPDPADSSGKIFDFSKNVINKFTGRKRGAVIIGLSDRIIRDQRRDLLATTIPIAGMFLLLSIIGSIILASIIIKPIRKLSHGAAVIGKGDLDYRIDINSSDELGRLANEFNIMTEMIKEAKDKEIENRIMEEQLEMAKDIQEGLNPMEFYDKDGIQIKGFTRAAKGVGGDYFDYIDIDKYRVGALISDVSGKGVPASLVMVMIRTVFTSYITRKDVDCARVVRAINDSLSADFAIDKFATLFFMIYDRRNGELAFSNAGHGPLFCYRASMKNCTITKLDGVPIGIMEDVDYIQARVKLDPGDMVVMYTDGITEMRNPEREEYGLKRVIHLMKTQNHLSANDFVTMLVDDVDNFRRDANPHDDMTTLVFKRIN